MSFQHQDLAAGRWKELPFVEQMANIGSEVERALNWKAKNKPAYAQNAFERALELLDLTMVGATSFARAKETARVREALVDYFLAANKYESTEDSWKKYFYYFNFAARKDR